MKHLFLSLFLLLSILSISAAEDWFPITAWGLKYNDSACTTWVEELASSFHGNSTVVGWRSESVLQALLNKGEDCSVFFFMTCYISAEIGHMCVFFVDTSQVVPS